MVEFVDGSTIAQASPPNMKGPIAYALSEGRRVHGAMTSIDWSQSSTWNFAPIDEVRFPAIRVAREVGVKGGGFTAIFNAANEVAVDAYLKGSIKFSHIVKSIEAVLSKFSNQSPFQIRDLADVSAIENDARAYSAQLIKGV